MPKQVALQNNFIAGLKTEFTGLNFPENAATDTSNCVYSIIGDVLRREGINFEANNVNQSINTNQSVASSYYRWKNAGGDGQTEILVLQNGSTLYFFQSSNSTISSPLSTTLIKQSGSPQTISLNSFTAGANNATISNFECQFADGNGYLFVFHPNCDPFYITLTGGNISSNRITIQTRDFNGLNDHLAITTRPVTLSNEHFYNLQNQGWGAGSAFWSGTTGTPTPYTNLGLIQNIVNNQQLFLWKITTGTWNVTIGITNPGNVVVGQQVIITGGIDNFNQIGPSDTYAYARSQGNGIIRGIVQSYPGSGSNMTITITDVSGFNYSFSAPNVPGDQVVGQTGLPWKTPSFPAFEFTGWTIQPQGIASGAQINTWQSAFNAWPSNADIWWLYKDSTGAFNPGSTINNVTFGSAPAPKGHFIINAFNQNPNTSAAGVGGITTISTTARPQTGCWYQGRIFYAGVNATQPPTGDQSFYTWTENIYFSQIITSQSVPQFGQCYQTNDPTDQSFFDILPSDGGVITIQGTGNIQKLFPIQNGVLVFASNGIWFITGSQGIGFTATDYTVTKISNIQTISGTSFINVLGYPFFWNEEGIYSVQPSKTGSLGFEVEPITVGTILTFYGNIPNNSKFYARGDYDPINYVVNWTYRSTVESGISNRYQFDSTLNFNVYNKAFYPYKIGSNNNCFVNGVVYMNYPPGAVVAGTDPVPQFKYLTSVGTNFTFSEENDNVTWSDWNSSGSSVDFNSYFVTGYSLAGKAVAKWQPIIIETYSRGSGQYYVSSIWDYASSGNSGRWSSQQFVQNPNNVTFASGISGPDLVDYAMYHRRHKLRGYGTAFQLKVSSVSGQPFDIMGWGVVQDINSGI